MCYQLHKKLSHFIKSWSYLKLYSYHIRLIDPDEESEHDGVAPLLAHPLPLLHLQPGLPSGKHNIVETIRGLLKEIFFKDNCKRHLFAPAVAVPTL